MTLRAASVLTALALALLAGCSDSDWLTGPPSAVGPFGEILVVTDSMTWRGPVGDAVRAELGQPVVTLPNQQGAFDLRYMPLTDRFFANVKKQRNVLFIGDIRDSTQIGDFLRARIPAAGQDMLRRGEGRGIYLRRNLWANGQVVTIAAGATDSSLVTELRERGKELRAVYDSLALTATRREMFERLRQVEAERDLLREHAFAVNIQHDYRRIQDTTTSVTGRTGRFIRYRRVLTDTWRDFFVYYEDNVDPTRLAEADLDQITDDLLRTFARGTIDSSYVQLDPRRPVSIDTVRIAGRSALEKKGLWRMINDFMGGSYVRTAFYVPEQQRLYVYCGLVFAPAPDLDKRQFLRQMEVIPRTFRINGHAADSTQAP